MTGHVRHGRKGTRRALSFVRAGNADAATASFNRLAMKRSSAVALVYISTPDCTFCRTWERYSLPKYLETAAGREFRFLEVKGATLHSPVAPSDWPAAEQDLAKQVGPSRGVPRFVVVVDRRVILNQFGTGNWDHRVGPLLLQMAIWRSTSPE
jgi:hypothetical protein